MEIMRELFCSSCGCSSKKRKGKLRSKSKGYGEKGLVSLQNLIQQEGGVLIACHSWLYLISIGDIGTEIYLKAIVVETPRTAFCHSGQLQIVGGYNARNRHAGDGLQKESGAVELVQGIGAFQYLIEDDEGAKLAALAELHELLETQELGIEIGNAMSKVVGGAHAGEELET